MGGWAAQCRFRLPPPPPAASLCSLLHAPPHPALQAPIPRHSQEAVSAAAGRPSSHSRLTQVAAMAAAGGAPAAAAAVDPKLVAMREALARADGGKGVQAFIVPSEDPHMVRMQGGREEAVAWELA